MNTQQETSAHNALKKQAKILLFNMGYTASEISEEYRLKVNGDKGFIIDVVGIDKDGKKGKTAIVCVHTDAIKAASLSLFFDKVILLPFNVEIFTLDAQNELMKNSETINKLHEKIHRLEEEKEQLKQDKELADRRHDDLSHRISEAKTFSIYLWKTLATLQDVQPPFWWSIGDDNNSYNNLKWAAFKEFVKEITPISGNIDAFESDIKQIKDKLEKEFYEKIINDAKQGLPDLNKKHYETVPTP
jgi:hypothetical protein